MPQLFPDGVNAVNLNRADTQAPAPLNVSTDEDFNTPALQGSMQQILSENLGQYVIVDFTMGTNTFQRRAGILYAVARSVIVLYNDVFQSFNVMDIFAVKTVSFFGYSRPQWLDQMMLVPLSGAISGDGGGLVGAGRQEGSFGQMTQEGQSRPQPSQTGCGGAGSFRSMRNR